jgi:hypothetical protein
VCHAIGMMGGNAQKLVDDLLQANKTLEGVPSWEKANNTEEYRLLFPVFVNGSSTDATVEIDAYPNASLLRFRIMFNIGKCAWRIDYTEYETHVNPADTFSSITPFRFTCPHYHSWEDNRRYCTNSAMPSRLKVARPLPDNIRQFDAAFRWFCGEINISQLPPNMVELPLRTTLI